LPCSDSDTLLSPSAKTSTSSFAVRWICSTMVDRSGGCVEWRGGMGVCVTMRESITEARLSASAVAGGCVTRRSKYVVHFFGMKHH
jgi:hypothetical protein